ncbi:hypothetical protein GWG54_15120 [Natronococcus sp. JC468]|uniref:hypothetical protein n=1 Tax=Natronococcus sp. JC468 TaxID=1961921 RepID=UPI00143B6E96|nr:hypothetical protein [Natronococcus sp. JC468]NKE37128.1 hypothetical protein [Natronococcus sp. JC468]
MNADSSITLRYTPREGNPRRIRLEPAGFGEYDRIVEERRDGRWCVVGHEQVDDVELEAPAAIVTGNPVSFYRGP